MKGVCDLCDKERHDLTPCAFVDGVPQIYVCFFCLKPKRRKPVAH